MFICNDVYVKSVMNISNDNHQYQQAISKLSYFQILHRLFCVARRLIKNKIHNTYIAKRKKVRFNNKKAICEFSNELIVRCCFNTKIYFKYI